MNINTKIKLAKEWKWDRIAHQQRYITFVLTGMFICEYLMLMTLPLSEEK